MDTFKSFESKIYTVNDQSFSDIAIELFHFQAVNNPLYKAYISNLSVSVDRVKTIADIPFLPISFFKQGDVRSGVWEPAEVFTSSGTTGMTPSRHPVRDVDFYHRHARRCFEIFFGPLTDYHFLALLPSYLERKGSSLISMMEYFIRESRSDYSGFYLYDVPRLLHDLEKLRHDGKKTILWGVSFALLDLAEQHPTDLSPFMIFETGGMKGRRKEITRSALHDILVRDLQATSIFSEYGMTELLSQAYTEGAHQFACPPWMKMICRDLTDPFQKGMLGETGGMNVVDLANWNSISFIETEDLGRVYGDGNFEILGRMDNSDVRGCNLLLEGV